VQSIDCADQQNAHNTCIDESLQVMFETTDYRLVMSHCMICSCTLMNILCVLHQALSYMNSRCK